MNSILYTGQSGLDALQKRIETISNNIANMNTAGYKRVDQSFQELLRNEIGELGTPLTEELEAKNPTIGSGVKVSDPYRVYDQGTLSPSSNSLELAINGNGFFGFENGDDMIFSRAANLSINEDGELVDSNGKIISIDGGKDLTKYDRDSIIIDTTGEIFATDEDGELDGVGKIILYDVENKEVLTDAGSGYYKALESEEILESDNKSDSEHFGAIKQGYSEMSNVEIGVEMIDLMILERAYQLNAKSLEAADEMWKMVNNIKR